MSEQIKQLMANHKTAMHEIRNCITTQEKFIKQEASRLKADAVRAAASLTARELRDLNPGLIERDRVSECEQEILSYLETLHNVLERQENETIQQLSTHYLAPR
jgi:predicted  nucleic acid-binding Zn-ribbon protein